MPRPVLHILGTAQLEGTSIARIVAALAGGLDPGRYRLHAWFLAGDGPLADELKAAGIEVRVFNWCRGARDPAGAWQFWRALRGENFAIVHQHFGARSVRWLARVATPARIVVHLHGHILESRGLSPIPLHTRGAEVVIATSRAVADWVVDRRACVVYPGVPVLDGDGALPRAASDRVLGTACRLVPMKGLPYLIHALALLRADFPDLRLEIAGAGPNRASLENQIRLLGLSDCVTWLGWRRDLAAAMARWDVFVQPSVQEPFGVAGLEAMAAGLPVVATSVGGVPELVDHGQTGWLVPPGDSGALAGRLRELLLNPAERRAMGTAGRARARQCFSTDQMVTAISEIYDDVLNVRNTRGAA